jgi:hypothetical protein
VLDPDSAELKLYQNGAFVPYRPEQTGLPEVRSSAEWYAGRREHLPFAVVKAGD